MNHLGKIALYLLLAAHALPPLPTLKLEKDDEEKEGVNKNEKCSSPWQVSKTIDSTVQYSTVQYSTVQYSTVQYSTVQYSTVQYSTTPPSRY